MKKFLTEISISIVMISIGCILCVFEFKDYRFVNAYADGVDGKFQTYETTVNKDNPLRIELDEYVYVDYEIDEDRKDEVTINVRENLNHKFSKNKLRITEYTWHSNSFGTYLDAWIEGLKDEKVYYFDSYYSNQDEEIVITCSSETRKYIEIID